MKNDYYKNIIRSLDNYYSGKVKKFGATNLGVDWSTKESQYLRFDKLTSVIVDKDQFSINDLGCGYGEMIKYLKDNYDNFTYFGMDLSSEMIDVARVSYKDEQSNCVLSVGSSLDTVSDYSLASGIFNVKFNQCDNTWLDYLIRTLNNMNSNSKEGFAFNCLTQYSDKHLMRDDLYYADPLFLFDYCKNNFSRNVALLHDYELCEFTRLVRL